MSSSIPTSPARPSIKKILDSIAPLFNERATNSSNLLTLGTGGFAKVEEFDGLAKRSF